MSIHWETNDCADRYIGEGNYSLTPAQKQNFGVLNSYGWFISTGYSRKIKFTNNSQFVLSILLSNGSWLSGLLNPGQSSAWSTCISGPANMQFYVYEAQGCTGNGDCEQGEKCVDGECVPCEKLVDGHGTLTLYGADSVDGTLLADSFQGEWDGSNSHEFYLPNGTPYAGALVIPNGIQANLKISAFYGFFGAASWSKVVFDGLVNQQKVEFNYPPAGDLPFGCLYSSKLLVEVTNFVSLGDCADDLVEPEQPVAPEPPIIEEPETPTEPEPEEPIDKEEHEGEPTEPEKPDKPDEPQNCDCENYIANSVQVGSDQIFDILRSVKDSIDRLSNNLTKDVDRVSLSINQAANVNNVALSAINTNLYNLLMFVSEKLYTELVQFREDFRENLSCGDRGIACIIEKATLKTVNHPVAGEIEVGLVDSVFNFAGKNIQESVEEIEPVHIENEYRVQSRRTENFTDE